MAGATCVHACQRLSSLLPGAATLCAGWSACPPDLWLCLAGLAKPSQQLRLGAGMLYLDTAALGQSHSRHGRSAQHPLALTQLRCTGIKALLARQLCGAGNSKRLEVYIVGRTSTIPFLYQLQKLVFGNVGSVLRFLLQFLPELPKFSVLQSQALSDQFGNAYRIWEAKLIPSRQPWPRSPVSQRLHSGLPQ